MKTKKPVTILLFALIALLFFSACGDTGEQSGGDTAVMADFSATTLTGDAFTQDNLKDYELTMVNIWTTWCGYCIEEMPELQVVYDNLPEQVNMITICGDGDSEAGTAEDILEENGCEFPVLIADDKLNDSLMSQISAYPTTVFVDSNGNLVGEPQVGVPQGGDSTADAYLGLIDDRLELLQ